MNRKGRREKCQDAFMLQGPEKDEVRGTPYCCCKLSLNSTGCISLLRFITKDIKMEQFVPLKECRQSVAGLNEGLSFSNQVALRLPLHCVTFVQSAADFK